MKYLEKKQELIEIEEFIKKIELIDDEDFKEQLKENILLVKKDGSFEIRDNTFIGKIKKQPNRDYALNIVMSDNMVEFIASYKSGSLNGKIICREDGTTYIKYNEQKFVIYENIKDGHKDKKWDSYNVTTDTKVHVFNEQGIEAFKYDEKVEENYYKNKKTGEKILHAPSCFENYVERRYCWRADNDMIIERIIRKHTYPNLADEHILSCDTDSYLIGKNVCPNNKKLPFGGNYIWIEKDLYKKYVTNQCPIDEVWENRGSAYQKKK